MDSHAPETLITPPDLNARIWRYTRPEYLEDILRKEALYFRRGDAFDDPYEGMLPDSYVAKIRRGEIRGVTDAETQVRYHLHHRSHGYASCWHMSPFESAAMWKLYATRGVAIKSSFSRLQHAFDGRPHTNGLDKIDVGLVQYDESFLNGPLNIRRVFLHKRPDFAHEREVRAFYQETSQRDTSGWFVDPSTPIGKLIHPKEWAPPVDQWISVSVEQLITGILVNPKGRKSLLGDIREIVRSAGFSIPVERSTLYEVSYMADFRR